LIRPMRAQIGRTLTIAEQKRTIRPNGPNLCWAESSNSHYMYPFYDVNGDISLVNDSIIAQAFCAYQTAVDNAVPQQPRNRQFIARRTLFSEPPS